MTTEMSAKVMMRHALLLAMMSDDPDEAIRVLLGPAAPAPAPGEGSPQGSKGG